MRVHGFSLEGVGGVVSCLIHVVVDGHEARVRQEDVVGTLRQHPLSTLAVAKLQGPLVRVHGVHGVAEVVGGGLVVAIVVLLLVVVLGKAAGDGDEAGEREDEGDGDDGGVEGYLTKRLKAALVG